MATSVRIAVVGDVHDDWNLQEDTKALQFLQPDLVLFTGDFGNENVELVRSVANLEMAKVVILGNHDAWTTQQFSGKKKDGVQLQLECRGHSHPYECKHLVKLIPRSWDSDFVKGSPILGETFCSFIYDNNNLGILVPIVDQDATKHYLHVSLMRCNKYIYSVMFTKASCGTDLAQAISHLKETTKFSIPLVVFGHMHKELAHGNGHRKMIVVGEDDTTYLNGAIVPRVKTLINEQGTSTIRAFTVVEILDGRLDKIAETWVSVIGDETRVEQEHILFKSAYKCCEDYFEMKSFPVFPQVIALCLFSSYCHPFILETSFLPLTLQ
ncbi:unnamed protein product, partial [Vitis vinifera]